jgi:hypothetical protein
MAHADGTFLMADFLACYPRVTATSSLLTSNFVAKRAEIFCMSLTISGAWDG